MNGQTLPQAGRPQAYEELLMLCLLSSRPTVNTIFSSAELETTLPNLLKPQQPNSLSLKTSLVPLILAVLCRFVSIQPITSKTPMSPTKPVFRDLHPLTQEVLRTAVADALTDYVQLLKSFDLYPDVYVLPGQVFQILYSLQSTNGAAAVTDCRCGIREIHPL